MRNRSALAGALAAGGIALIAGPGSAATVGVLTLVDAGCCSISDGSKPQNELATTGKDEATAAPETSNEASPVDERQSGSGGHLTGDDVANDKSERAGDSLGPDAVALKESSGSNDDSPEAVNAVAEPDPSVLSRLLTIFADLRATLFGGG